MDIIDRWVERIRGLRKWSVMVIVIAVAVVFRVMNYVNGVEFVDLIKGIAVAFMASNAIEHVKYFFKGKKKEDED